MPQQKYKLRPLQVEHWDPILAPILKDMEQAPIHVHQLMAHNPTLLRAWWNFRNHSVKGGTLGEQFGELAILRVAVHMRAWYEWGSHVDRALNAGLALPTIEKVLVFQTDVAHWSQSESVLLQAVDELVCLHQIEPATLTELSGHFDDAQLMDLMAISGMYVILATMIKTWGLQLDPAVQARIAKHSARDKFLRSADIFHEECRLSSISNVR